ncbi:hypothetical protein [Streptomyces sp. 43Y-GA-1]|uniref:hypothetical protein n=1 Tax=Streptomyces sp. 43Y-GA-1 TaxID=2939435 RepID=UPI0020C17F21|nr:hypothetical protein [Streptomyces sp. 43Y-GA-1]MCL6293253.1 hypothetical protein [Streptomyces sp. 43Y-GA-1]
MAVSKVLHGLEFALRRSERGFKTSDFSPPATRVRLIEPGLEIGDDLLHPVLLVRVGAKGGAADTSVFMDACGAVIPGADSERDFAELEVGNELVPLFWCEVAVFLARSELPTTGDVGPVVSDDVLGIDRGVSHRGVHVLVSEDLRGDMWRQPGLEREQVGHSHASTTAIYMGVSNEYRNTLLAASMKNRLGDDWDVIS